MGWASVDWIELAQDRDQWLPHVNTAMKIRVPQEAGIFLDYLSDNQLLKKASATRS
jgi:hypothetical protein